MKNNEKVSGAAETCAVIETMKKLCAVRGISGAEDKVREAIIKEIDGFADSITTDALGNLIVYKKGAAPAGKKLLLSAHMDEVGFIVTYIENNGMLRFTNIGGIMPAVSAGRQVRVGKNAIPGVIGTKPVHMLGEEQRNRFDKLDAMLIDIGAADKEDAGRLVAPGDMVTFVGEYKDLGGDRFTAKAIDDRVGCALLIELIKGDLPFDTYFSFTVQEETGCHGAKTVGFSVRPEIAVAVEGTTAGDIPSAPEHKKVCGLGKGPVISYMDKGTIYSRELYEKAVACAERENIGWQTKEGVYGGNESKSFLTAAGGAKVLAVSLPVRYIHSASSVAQKSDVAQMYRLLKCLINEFGGAQ